MIIRQRFVATSTRMPLTFNFSCTLPCVTFSPKEGRSYDGIVNVDIEADTSTCLTQAQFTLTIIDSYGCVRYIPFSVDDPCPNFTLSDIDHQSPYTFSVSAGSPGCTSVSFVWSYETALFDVISVLNTSFTSTLRLQPKAGITNFPATTGLLVSATDCYKCTKTSSFTLAFCKPLPQDFVIGMYCVGTPTYYTSSQTTIPTPTGCTNMVIDWDSIAFSLPSGFNVYDRIGDRDYIFRAISSVAAGTYIGTYTVSSTDGIPSQAGNITFIVNACDPDHNIFIPDKTQILECSVGPGDSYIINIENAPVTAPGVDIDWGTWQLVTPPTPVSPSITLDTDINGNHLLIYEVPDPIVADAFAWTVCDTNGNCAEAAVYTVIDCVAAPIAVADTACVSCGNSVTISVLDNDDGNGSPASPTSIQIATAPQHGTIVIPGNGTIIYTPSTNYIGSDTFQYNFRNGYGIVSNNATVTIDILCAGVNGIMSLCKSA